MTSLSQILKAFREKYFDKNTPSGLNQKDFNNFPELVKDIYDNFLTATIKSACAKMIVEERKENTRHIQDESDWNAGFKQGYMVSRQDQLERLKNILE